jgi:hypothetical protein
MRLALLIGLLLASTSALADPVSLVMLAGSYMVTSTAFVITGYALMIGASIYGAAEQRKKADADARKARQAYNDSLKDRTATRIATDAPLRVVYGRARVGSDIVAMFTNGAKDEYKYLVCVHAAHECESIEEIWVNNVALGTLTAPDLYGCQEIDPSQVGHPYIYKNTISVDSEAHTGSSFTLAHTPVPNSVRCVWGSGDNEKVQKPDSIVGAVVTVPTSRTYTVHYDYIEYISRVRVTKHLGTPTDVADPSLALLFPDKWSASSLLRDLCYTVIRLDLNQQEFQSGVPPIEVLIKGKKVLDLRSMISAWNENPALCIYDYLTGDLCGVAGDSLYDIGTAQAATPNSLTMAASANTADDYYKNGKVFITGGAGAGQSRNVVSSRRNKHTYSENTGYSALEVAGDVFTRNTGIGMSGGMTADRFIIGTASSGNHRIRPTPVSSQIAGNTYSRTWYLRPVGVDVVSFLEWSSTSVVGSGRVSLTGAGSFITNPAGSGANAPTILDWGIELLDNGIYKFWVSWLCNYTASHQPMLYTYDPSGGTPWAGDGVVGVEICGIQFEKGDVATEYIRTEATAAVGVAVDSPWAVVPDSTSTYEVVVQAADIPVDDYITAANVCDESITIDGAAAPRYTLNGVVTSDQPQKRVLEQMVQAMAGTLVETTWSISAGKYVAPVMALDQSDIVGPLSVMSGTPDADLYNSVRAQYVSAENGYVSTDCAPYQNAVYLLVDGKESWNDVQLPFTDKKQRIHNLARIMMEDQRNGMTVRASMSLKVWRLRISERVSLTSSFLGQASKVYRITDRRFSPDQMIELTMKEDSSLIWDEADAVLADETVNTNLPNPFIVGLCGNVQMTEMLYETTGSAGVKAGAILTWDAPADVSVIDYELEYKAQTSGVWIELANIRATRYLFEDIAPGIYDFRVKARNIFNVVGQYTDIKSFEVFGLNTPPADVSNFTVKPFGGMALCKWDRTQDLDVKIGGDVEIRFSPVSSATWANASLIPDGENNGDASNAIVSLATGTYFAKFKDSSGNYSLNAASFVVTEALVTGWTTVFTSTQHTGFTGTKTNCTVTAGILYLDSGQLSAEYLFSARLDMTTSISRRFHARINSYSSIVGDTLDARLTNMDTWASFDGSIVDDTNAVVDIAISDDDVTYSAWMPFMVADFKCRYAKFRLRMTSGVVTHAIQVNELEVLVKV